MSRNWRHSPIIQCRQLPAYSVVYFCFWLFKCTTAALSWQIGLSTASFLLCPIIAKNSRFVNTRLFLEIEACMILKDATYILFYLFKFFFPCSLFISTKRSIEMFFNKIKAFRFCFSNAF